jgi:glycogen synthase kinase 3 beta
MNGLYREFKFPQVRQLPWSKVFRSGTPIDAVDYVSSLLVYPPTNRPHPLESLTHTFFDQLRDPNCRLPNGNPLPNLFNFSAHELQTVTSDTRNRLIPEWYA